MIPAERQRRILRVLQDQGTASIAQLCELLGVSHMTVRRDIAALEELGRVTSVSGGVALPARFVLDQSHAVKAGIRQAQKAAIAAHAATMVSAGDLVLLDAGTTTLAIAHALAEREDLSYITNDLAIATFLSDQAHSDNLYLAAGHVDRANLSSDGEQAASAIAEYNIDVAFMSTSSFDLRGASVPTGAKKIVKRSIIDNSKRTVLATDSTKYGKVAALRAVRLSEFDAIVTDAGLHGSAIDGIAQQNIPLVLVDATSNHIPERTRKVQS